MFQCIRTLDCVWYRYVAHLINFLSELAPEGDGALGPLASAAVKHVTVVKRWTIQVEGHSGVRVGRVLYSVKSNGIW